MTFLATLEDIAGLIAHYLPWRVWRRRRAQRACPHGDKGQTWITGSSVPSTIRWCQVCHKEWR